MGAQLGSVAVLGANVRYARTGEDYPDCLILLHGLGADHRGLMTMARAIHGFDIVALDLPGFGLSGAMQVPYTMEAYAAVVEQLRIQLGRPRIHLAGHSLGANIALVYAARYGAALESLCLLNPVWRLPRLTKALARLYYGLGVRLPPPADRFWLTSRTAVYIGDMLTFTTDDRMTRRNILAQDYVNMRRADLRAIKEIYRSYLDTPWEQYAARIAARTLIVTGSRDTVARPSSMARLQEQIARSRTTVVPDAGHLLPSESPGPVGALVNRFLTSIADRPVPRQASRQHAHWHYRTHRQAARSDVAIDS
jgi:pimeloyl-ACP methyl ester carboxylesterase